MAVLPDRCRRPRALPLVLIALAVGGCAGSEGADEGAEVVEAAVAANLAAAHAELARRFEAGSGVPVRTSLGATGQLYAQIVSGAPYDLLLAADDERPARLEDGGLAVAGSRFTYAVGRLALYAPGWAPLPDPPWPLLTRPDVRVAIANPRTAPYGVAALAVMEKLGLEVHPTSDLVVGETVAQAFQYVRSGAAEVGLVALSQVLAEDSAAWRVVPEALHPPLRQDAVLLSRAAEDGSARAYLAFLRSAEAAAVLARFGYGKPDHGGDPPS